MGLHPEMKAWFKETFPDCFHKDVPSKALGTGLVQVCDAMWILYKFAGEENACFENLVDHVWWSVKNFYERGGHTFIACFDAAAHVPEAKRDEQKKRKRGTEGVIVRMVDGLPQPWRAGLADAVVREVRTFEHRSTCKNKKFLFFFESLLTFFLLLAETHAGTVRRSACTLRASMLSLYDVHSARRPTRAISRRRKKKKNERNLTQVRSRRSGRCSRALGASVSSSHSGGACVGL